MIFPESLFSKLNLNEVHVWCTSLDEEVNYNYLFKYLNEVESLKVKRLIQKKDFNNALAGKAITKHLLSYYLNVPSDQIKIKYSNFDKPYINDIHFNISHSANKLVHAFCLNKEIGIDIEEIKEFSVIDQVAKSYFSVVEYNNYIKSTSKIKTALFYKIWSRKESFIKLVGDGLTYPLKEFTVDTSLNIKNPFIKIKENNIKIKIIDLNLFDSYASALAIPLKDFKVSIKEFKLKNLYELSSIKGNN